MAVITYFGVPGSGKTTHAASIVWKNLKKGIPTFCNVDIKGTIPFKASDIGRYQIENCDLIIDECGIEFNNRKFKSLPQETITWLKYYRHYGVRNIYIYSQSYEDMDITLRRLSDVLYRIRKSLIPGCFVTRRISVSIDIDKDTHQIIDKYFWQLFSKRLVLGFRYWHMFDSWAAPQLASKEWHINGMNPQTDYDYKSMYKRMKREKSLIYKIGRKIKNVV